jgi:hypothetical protein
MSKNNNAGRKVRQCPYHGESYVCTNFMRRYVLPGDVVAKLGHAIQPPFGSRQTDTHQLACAHKHGQLVNPS